jgi:hypothetical protein
MPRVAHPFANIQPSKIDLLKHRTTKKILEAVEKYKETRQRSLFLDDVYDAMQWYMHFIINNKKAIEVRAESLRRYHNNLLDLIKRNERLGEKKHEVHLKFIKPGRKVRAVTDQVKKAPTLPDED